MSAPDSSNSKAPPSLLADTAKGSQANGSRILANLEGRVEPPTDKPRRSKAPVVLVALLVVAAGGWGAWHVQQHGLGDRPLVAASPGPAVAQTAAAPAGASAASAAQVSAKAAPAEAASASQAATIVADDGDNKDSKPSAAPTASAVGGVDDSNRLSRALANGAEASETSAPPAEAAKGAKPVVTAANQAHHERETAAAHAKHDHEAASNRHASAVAVAQEKKDKQDKQHPAHNSAVAKDDPDADLLAALVARTKPAATKPGVNGATTKVSATTGDPQLAERVKECGTRGFFEDQLCRWRVCDGHWGKDPACPGAAPAKPQQ